jgi:uncharacterized protein YqhQ
VGVGGQNLFDVLVSADGAARLPRLGGMARPNGVVIVSERYWAFAARDGSLREGEMPAAASRTARLPLLRGLARLASSLTPLFRGGGVARRRERIVLAAAAVLPFAFFFAPAYVANAMGIVLTVGLIGFLFRGRTLFLHGAEHRAIAAVESRQLVSTWEGSSRPSRFALRCGTNFAALAIPVTVFADRVFPLDFPIVTPLVVTLLSLALTMELWLAVQASASRFSRVLLLPGLGLQRLTTREPALDETRIALTAVASVLRRELA